jgi:hypothetical protein
MDSNPKDVLNLAAKAGFSSQVIEVSSIEEYCKDTACICSFAILVHYFTVNGRLAWALYLYGMFSCFKQEGRFFGSLRIRERSERRIKAV